MSRGPPREEQKEDGVADPDVSTIEGVLAAMYDVLSGPAGPRDWSRERKLMAPGALLVPTERRPEVRAATGPMDVEGYIASRAPFFEANDFYEIESARQIFRFGNVAHVLSAYEARRSPRDAEAQWRGINSVQLYHDGSRWWIVSIAWDNARPDNPLPEWARAAREKSKSQD
jgi:hypothetical protein